MLSSETGIYNSANLNQFHSSSGCNKKFIEDLKKMVILKARTKEYWMIICLQTLRNILHHWRCDIITMGACCFSWSLHLHLQIADSENIYAKAQTLLKHNSHFWAASNSLWRLNVSIKDFLHLAQPTPLKLVLWNAHIGFTRVCQNFTTRPQLWVRWPHVSHMK